jgi:hypothetical protein
MIVVAVHAFMPPNLIMYGAMAALVATLMKLSQRGRRMSRGRRFLLGLPVAVVVYTVLCLPYVFDYARFFSHRASEGGYHPYDTMPMPDGIAVETARSPSQASDLPRCEHLCEELLGRRLVSYVDMVAPGTGVARRFRLLASHDACADARAELDKGGSREASDLIFHHFHEALAYDLCLSVEPIGRSDAPVTVRYAVFDHHRDQGTAGAGYYGRVQSYQRTEVWANTAGTRRVLATSEGIDVELPVLPPVFTIPFQTHGIGIDGYAGKLTTGLAYEGRPMLTTVGPALLVTLTGEVPRPPPADAMPTLLSNLSAGPAAKRQAAEALSTLLATGHNRLAADPAWLPPIIAALEDSRGSTKTHLLYVVAAFGPTAKAAAPAVRGALRTALAKHDTDSIEAGFSAASAIGPFTKDDVPWLNEVIAWNITYSLTEKARAAVEKLNATP